MDALVAVLEDARRLGFLGPGPVEPHLERALALAGGAAGPPDRALDLGSGGGVPGLPLAFVWPGARWVLLDAQARRTTFLEATARRLGIERRVEVVRAPAEEAAHRPELRGAFDLVVARSFGAPPVTTECSVGFLRVGGRLVVAEPPASDATAFDRWPEAGLAALGLREVGRGSAGTHWVSFEAMAACPAHVPRAVGRVRKRPLW